MRIAIDIDSTLHHYWDILSEVSVRRFGIELPYDEQFTWGITRLRPEQLELCIEESHTDERILAGTPYPGAVEAVRRWHEAGHFIHITSHRALDRKDATAAWLQRIGLPFDDLHCSYDKVSRCVELEIDLLIDDGPENLAAALEHGIAAATIAAPLESGPVRGRGCPLRAGLARAGGAAGAVAGQAGHGGRGGEVVRMEPPAWTDALALLQDDLLRRDAAVRTRRAYGVDLSQFARWASERGLGPGDVGPRDVRRYVACCPSGRPPRARPRASSRRCAPCSPASASTA